MFSEIVKDEIYKGYRVLVKKMELELPLVMPSDYWYCGYVEIPKDSKFYGMQCDDADKIFIVHGGVTFVGKLFETGNFVLGFDCYHLTDSPIVQNEEFTLKECYNLVEQIIIKEKSGALSEDEEQKLLKKKDDRERTERLPFWQQIIEDLTGYEIANLFYDDEYELIEVLWKDKYRGQLVINIRMDSLRACTHDVIRQTYDWIASEILKETP